MINEKGLSPESADLIGQYVCLHGMLSDNPVVNQQVLLPV